MLNSKEHKYFKEDRRIEEVKSKGTKELKRTINEKETERSAK